MTRLRSVLLVAASLTAFCAARAEASLINFDAAGLTLDTAPTSVYKQSSINPCVIGAPNCLNGGFPFTNAGSGGAGTTSDELSPLYTLAQITGKVGGNSFVMGVDWNQNSNDQILYLFEAIYFNASSTEVGRQTFDPGAAGYAPAIDNQGNGLSDFLLTGFAIPGTAASVEFHAKWFNTDGADRYFLIGANAPLCTPENPCTPIPFDIDPVPEPASLVLLGSGLVGIGLVVRRRLGRRS